MKLFTILFSLLICQACNSQNEEIPVHEETPAEKTIRPTYEEFEKQLEEEEDKYENPEFPGGQRALKEFIQKETKYPEEAANKKLEGKVYISFEIEKNGELTNIKVARGEHELLNNEAMRVISEMPNWIPGTLNGEPVTIRHQLPIVFTLN